MASRVRRPLPTVWLLVLCAASTMAQSSRAQHAHLSLIAAPSDSPGSQWVGLRFQLDPGWHIYWTNPGDSGEPPKVAWQLPSGIQAGDMQFPTPHRIADHGMTDYGYESEAVLLSKLTVSAGAASNKPEIGADIRYLVCREICVPAKDHVSLNLAAENVENTALVQAAQARLPQSLPPSIHLRAVDGSEAIALSVSAASSKLGLIIDFIPSDAQLIDNSVKPHITKSRALTQVRLKKSEQLDHPAAELRGLLITRDKAYNIAVPITATKSSQKTSASKHS